jgi:hypothetical protein
MDTKRKIQISASAVIANGILALAFITPSPSFAQSCANYFNCDTTGVCPTFVRAFCLARAPGCTLAVAQCVTNAGCGANQLIECYYAEG